MNKPSLPSLAPLFIMSSIPSSHPNPNPNPQFSQPSISIKPVKFKCKKNKNIPNWLELPEEVLFLIFSKLNTIDIIENVQKSCMLFRKLCKSPSMFKVIDMTLEDAYMDLPYDPNVMTRFAVDRSCGCLVDIYLEYVCNDDTLTYIVDRSKNLKHLRLGHYIDVSDEGLIEAVKKLPLLEGVELILCSYSVDTVEAIGRTCPSLKSFSLNAVGSSDRKLACNEEALAIAKNMPNLRNLQLIGNHMTNEGLKEILDGCPLLESLDLRACFLVDLSGDLGKRCELIKNLRLPFDSTADYDHEAYEDHLADKWRGQQNDYDSGFGF
ncbi:putative F-box/LRR-repeat protein 23 [Spinacia oleracea]|uniref:F-box/LRR-repeat protein 23 n=1 Tax=Spinacia oleracea TaxID=3562 RepID=A0A9R0J7J7_SPIOL|nr:putative F-box/LRR-repeat protein 23 [Spinacia oleracea]